MFLYFCFPDICIQRGSLLVLLVVTSEISQCDRRDGTQGNKIYTMCRENKIVKNILKTFFVLMFFAILNFFLALKILFLAFSFFVILPFSIHATCDEGNSRATKNENAKNQNFQLQKNTPKPQKNV